MCTNNQQEFVLILCFLSYLNKDIPTVDGPIPLPTSIAVSSSLQNPLLMPSHLTHPFMSVVPQCTVNLPAPYHKPISSYSFGLDTFSSALDSLDSLSISESQTGMLTLSVKLCHTYKMMGELRKSYVF